MKVFLDANILVAVLNKEYPLFSSAARNLSLADNSRFDLCTSRLYLAIVFYFSGKKSGIKTSLPPRLQHFGNIPEPINRGI